MLLEKNLSLLKTPASLCTWPAEIERLTERLRQVDDLPQWLLCNPVKAAELRFEARQLAARVEELKRRRIVAEGLAVAGGRCSAM